MPEPKTRPTGASVSDFLAGVENAQRRSDAEALAVILAEVTGDDPVMWGTSIVGYGAYQGSTGAWPMIGFSPRKTSLVLYVMPGFAEPAEIMARLGKVRTGGSCLYINRLDDVDRRALRDLAEWSVTTMRSRYSAAHVKV